MRAQHMESQQSLSHHVNHETICYHMQHLIPSERCNRKEARGAGGGIYKGFRQSRVLQEGYKQGARGGVTFL